MSNPFATFRKNQKYWMAALVLIAILAFIIAPAIDMITRSFRGGGGSNQVIAKWDGGRLTQAEVEESLSKRVALRNFLTSLAKKVIAAGGNPAVPGFMQFNGQIFSLGVNDNISDQTVTMTKIMLTQAQRMGVEFDDLAADEFLKEYCNGKITDSEFNELLRTNNLTIFEVRELIKQDLTTTTAEELAMGGRQSPSPGKLWQNFMKLNQTAKVEAYKFATSDYVSKVSGKPTEAQLQELYESGKGLIARADSPEPGFARPAQANVEYVESNYSAWFEAEKAKVTEDELKAEYEKQVAAGLLKVPTDYKAPTITPPTTPATDAPSATPATTETPATGAPATTEPATSAPATTETPATTTETPAKTPEAPSNPTAPATTLAPTAEVPGTTIPATETPAVPVPEVPTVPSKDPSAGNPQSSRSRTSSELRLVSFVQEEPAVAASQEPAAGVTPPATPAETAAVVQEATTPPATTATPPATAADATPAATAPAAQTPVVPATGDGEIAVAEPGKPATPPMRDMTFDEARDTLLRTLADNRASKISGELINKVQSMMREYYLANRQYMALKNADVATRQVKQPVRPDLKKFAEENGLKWAETGLGESSALAATQFGRSVVLDGDRGVGLVSEVAPLQQLDTFNPLQSQFQGLDGYYLYYFWKTESKPSYIPPLTEVRDQVEDAWRRIESRKYAEEAAQAMLKKVGSGESPWAGALSETEQSLVVSTGQFTWLSRFGNEIQLSSVGELEQVGDEFMKQVFSTEANKFGVAANNAKTVYYLFRVLEKTPESELQTRFSDDPVRQGPKQIANNEMQSTINNWRNKVIEELNVQFP